MLKNTSWPFSQPNTATFYSIFGLVKQQGMWGTVHFHPEVSVNSAQNCPKLLAATPREQGHGNNVCLAQGNLPPSFGKHKRELEVDKSDCHFTAYLHDR